MRSTAVWCWLLAFAFPAEGVGGEPLGRVFDAVPTARPDGSLAASTADRLSVAEQGPGNPLSRPHRVADSIPEQPAAGIGRKDTSRQPRPDQGGDSRMPWLLFALSTGALLVSALWNRWLAGEVKKRKRAEAALDARGERLAKMIENVPGMIFEFQQRRDGSTFFPQVSGGSETMFGLAPEALHQSAVRIFDCIHPEDRVGFDASVDRSRQTMEQWRWEGRVRSAAGQYGWFQGLSSPERQADGGVLWRGIILDISERKRAEAARSESEERFRALFNSAGDAILIMDETRCVDCNDRSVEVFGVQTREEIVGRSPVELSPPVQPDGRDSRGAARERIAEAMAGRAQFFGWLHIRPDGTLFEAEVSLRRLDLPGRNLLQAIVRDVSERKRTEAALEQERRFTNAVLDSVPGLLYLYDDRGRLVRWNKQHEILTGYSADELARMSLTDWYRGDPEEEARVVAAVRRIPVEGHAETEARLLTKNGSRVSFYLTAVNLRLEERDYFVGIGIEITERRRAEAALRASQERFAAFMANNPAAAWMTDRQGMMTYASPGYARMFPVGDPTGRSLFDLYPEPIAREYVANNERVLAADRVVEVVESGLRADGSPGRFLVYKFPVPSEAGGLQVGGTAIDITERERAEANVRESRQRLDFALQGGGLGIWDWYPQSGAVAYGGLWVELLGFSPAEAGSRVEFFVDLVHPEDRPGVLERLSGHVEGRLPAYESEHRMRTRSGGWKWVLDRGKVVERDPQGRALRATGVIADITERKRAEEALRDNEEKYKRLIETTNTGYVIVDGEGCVTDANPEYIRLTGRGRLEDVVGRRMQEWTAPRDIERSAAEVRQCLARGWIRNLEIDYVDAGGRIVPVEINATVFRTAEKVQIMALCRDATQRRQLEEQFRQAQKLEAIGQLAAGVAHDFNNILTIVQGNAAILVEAPGLAADETEMAAEIVEAAERAAGLTRHLLLFSRRQALQTRSLNLNETVAQMTKMLQRVLGEDIALHSNYAPGLPSILADAGMVEQVVLNLAVNARDAMPGGGSLTLETSVVELAEGADKPDPAARPGRYVCLAVTDTGCGIEAGNLPRIFDPFFTTKPVGKGTGLGLASVYGIVKQHQGWIKVASEVGKGTAFCIGLPASEQPQGGAEAPLFAAAIPRGSEVILVVEDELAVRHLVSNVLQRCGYTVLVAASGTAALKVWRQHSERIQLLFTDMIMPEGMTGRNLAERLLQEKPGLKVVCTSGYSAEVVGEGQAFLQEAAFLQKPFSPAALAQAVRNCLDRPR